MKNVYKILAVLSVCFITGCATQPTHNNRYATTQNTSQYPLSDAGITASVKSAFISQDLFTSKDVASMTIHVETVNGVVYLTGRADNRTQARNAVSIAKSVDGVKRVVSKVRISRHA